MGGPQKKNEKETNRGKGRQTYRQNKRKTKRSQTNFTFQNSLHQNADKFEEN